MYTTTTNSSYNLNASKQLYYSRPRSNSAIRRSQNLLNSSLNNTVGGGESDLTGGGSGYGLPRVFGANLDTNSNESSINNTKLYSNRAQSASSGMRQATTSMVPQYSSMFQSHIMNNSNPSSLQLPTDYDSLKSKVDKKNTIISSSSANQLVLIRPASSNGKQLSLFPNNNGNATSSSMQLQRSNTHPSNLSTMPFNIQSILKASSLITNSKINSNPSKNPNIIKRKVVFANPLTSSEPLANPFEFPKKQQQQNLIRNTNSNLNDSNHLALPKNLSIDSLTSSSRDPSPISIPIISQQHQQQSHESASSSPPIFILGSSSSSSTGGVTITTQGVKSGGGLFNGSNNLGNGWGNNNNNTTGNSATISPVPINSNSPSSNTLPRKIFSNPFTIGDSSQASSTSSSPVKPPLFTSLIKEEENPNIIRPAAILAKPSTDFEQLLKSMNIEDDASITSSNEIISDNSADETNMIHSPRSSITTNNSDGITVQINSTYSIQNDNTKKSMINNNSIGIADKGNSSMDIKHTTASPFEPIKSTPSMKPILTSISTSNNIDSNDKNIGSSTSILEQANTAATSNSTTLETIKTENNQTNNKQQTLVKKKFQRPSLTEQLAQISAKASAITSDIRAKNPQETSSFQNNLNNAIMIGRNNNGIYMNNTFQDHQSNEEKLIGIDSTNTINNNSNDKKQLVFTMPSKSFSIGSLICKYPSPVLFYTDRFEYLFNHPYESSAINMIIYYRDMQGVSIVGTKLRFKLSRKLALFLGDFDPQNPLHMIVLELSTSSSITAIRDKIVPLIAQFK